MNWQTMSRTRRVLISLTGAAVLGAIAFAGYVLHDLSAAYPIQTTAAAGDALQAKIARGRYVAVASDCVACHTAPGGKEFAGGLGLDTPFGEIRASNITQDRKTGLGGWTLAEFDRAIRHGKGRNGYLYPAMPYTAYTKLTDRDVDDLWAYMRTVRPVANAVDENQLPFPLNQRWLLAGWNILFFKDERFDHDSALTAQQNRGAYLVDGAAHCTACHTAKNLLGGDSSAYLQGGTLAGWHANDLTPNRRTGLGRWTNEDVTQYLRTGSNRFSVASADMGLAVEHSLQHLSRSDLNAIAAYLRTLPASKTRMVQPLAAMDDTMQLGKRVFESQCTACHGSSGEGMRRMIPNLTYSATANADDPASLLHIVLKGGDGPMTHGNPTGAGMPRFDWKLSDAQVAAVLTYVRNSWGNAAAPVKESDVAAARKDDAALQPLRPAHP